MTRPSAFFVTGTDTEIGKTSIASALLHAARHRGMTTAAGKPVASGSALTPEGLRNDDALALQRECQPPLSYEQINPFAFAPAIAPHIAAEESRTRLDVPELKQKMRHLLSLERDLTLIEGAGGWRVPLHAEARFSDLAVALKLPVILVVGMRLGALNHACLTQEAIEADGLEIAGWVANIVDVALHDQPDVCRTQANLDTLSQLMHAPCLGVVPWLDQPTPGAIAEHLDLSALMPMTTH